MWYRHKYLENQLLFYLWVCDKRYTKNHGWSQPVSVWTPWAWRLSLTFRFPYLSSVTAWRLSLTFRFPYLSSVTAWRLSLTFHFPYLSSVTAWRLSLTFHFPYLSSVAAWGLSVTFHFPYLSSVTAWGLSLTFHFPYLSSVTAWGLSLTFHFPYLSSVTASRSEHQHLLKTVVMDIHWRKLMRITHDFRFPREVDQICGLLVYYGALWWYPYTM